MKENQDRIGLLLSDPEFIKWVKNSNKELDTYWKNWMLAHPNSLEEIKLARELVSGLRIKEIQASQDERKADLLRILADERQRNGIFELPVPDHKRILNQRLWSDFGQWTKVAAILIITVLFSFLYHSIVLSPLAERPQIEAPKPKLISKFTNIGEKLNFNLPDGTSVWLNSGSELTFPERFDSLERKVTLNGEGYFEVFRDTSRSFKVVSGSMTTEALGTSFNINNEDKDKLIISLLSGTVKIKGENSKEEIFLEPGLQLNFFSKSQKSMLNEFSVQDVIGWKSGVLSFSNATFEEVIKQLERWYGVKITVQGRPSGNWHLTGIYKNQNLDLVLDRMAFIETFQYSIDNKNIQIKF